MKSLFFIIDKPLHGNVCAQEFLDMALMAAAFDQRVVLLFEGDGVYALMKNQRPEVIDLKDVSPVLKALSIYDINDISVEKESMDARAMVAKQLVMPVNIVSRGDIKRQMASADQVFSF
ncbi:MAG: sulfurtransferase complex subunit TusC [Cycloclasticus sp.]